MLCLPQTPTFSSSTIHSKTQYFLNCMWTPDPSCHFRECLICIYTHPSVSIKKKKSQFFLWRHCPITCSYNLTLKNYFLFYHIRKENWIWGSVVTFPSRLHSQNLQVILSTLCVGGGGSTWLCLLNTHGSISNLTDLGMENIIPNAENYDKIQEITQRAEKKPSSTS